MNKLKKSFKNYYVLNDISGILFWDNATNLPSESIASRSEQMSILSEYTDTIFRSSEIINEISSINPSELDEINLKNFKLMKEIISRENAVDSGLKSKLIQQKLKCEHLWRKARQENNSLIIEKEFNYLLSLVKEEASQLSDATQLNPYNSLISKYDMDYNSSKIDNIFSVIKSEIIPQYLNSNKIKDPYVFNSNFSKETILENTKIKLKELNFDFTRGRIDQSLHPFCGGANDDVRITTRFEDNILETLSAIFHETGHGVYEQNRPNQYLYEPVGQSRSLSVHESQSLFYENHIFKSHSYFSNFAKIFKLDENLTRSFNEHYHKIRSNPIRVSSDEFSYPIHVYIRYEIEKIIFSEKIEFQDIKSLWNSYYKKFLDIEIKEDSVGILQDIHWFEGIFGYFPTYALGAMISSQIKYHCPFYDAFLDNPSKQNIRDIVVWLNTNIHQKASLLSSDEMLQNISGEKLNSTYYSKHLKDRFIK